MGSHQDLIWLQGRALESDLICAGGSCGTIHHSEGISQQWQSGGGDRGHRAMFDRSQLLVLSDGKGWSVRAIARRRPGAFEFRVQLSNLPQPELDFPDNE
jgi:hypothetical protein